MRLQNKTKVSLIVGDECRKARLNSLEMTLQALTNKTGYNLKTLSGFENGRSSNLYLLYVYFALLEQPDRKKMMDNILERIE